MGRRPSRFARGSQPPGPPSFRGLRLPRSRSRLRRPGSPKELEEGPPVRRAGRQAHDFPPPRLSAGHHARLRSPAPANLPGALAQFPASAVAGHALHVLFLPNRIPCGGRRLPHPGIPGSSADAHSRPTERRGRPFSSLTARGNPRPQLNPSPQVSRGSGAAPAPQLCPGRRPPEGGKPRPWPLRPGTQRPVRPAPARPRGSLDHDA